MRERRAEEAHRAVAPRLRRKAAILERREFAEDVGALETAPDAEPGDAMGRKPGDLAPLIEDAAAARLQLARQQVDERRLAGAVGADDGVDLARQECQRHVGDGGETAELAAQTAHHEARLRHDRSRAAAPAP